MDWIWFFFGWLLHEDFLKDQEEQERREQARRQEIDENFANDVDEYRDPFSDD